MGCSACGQDEAYLGVKVLKKLGINAVSKEFECGCEFVGERDDLLKKLVRENRSLLSGYKMVVVGCSRCYYTLKHYYNFIEVRHITQVIDERLSKSAMSFSGSGEVFYHDPAYLSRFETVMDEPRSILQRLGYSVREFRNNHERADCCGGYSPIPEVRERAVELLLHDIPPDSLVTSACPNCTSNLLRFNKPNSKITIKPFLELVDEALGIQIPDDY